MINVINNPIAYMLSVCNEMYPEVDCELCFSDFYEEFADEQGKTPCGVTIFPENDDEKVIIQVALEMPLMAIVEIIAHEFAHVVVGADVPEGEEHGEEWQNVFDSLHTGFCAKVQEMAINHGFEIVEIDYSSDVPLTC